MINRSASEALGRNAQTEGKVKIKMKSLTQRLFKYSLECMKVRLRRVNSNHTCTREARTAEKSMRGEEIR